jgi:hypothetical protein
VLPVEWLALLISGIVPSDKKKENIDLQDENMWYTLSDVLNSLFSSFAARDLDRTGAAAINDFTYVKTGGAALRKSSA